MRDEWKYILGTRDCFINLYGDVQQNGEIVKPYMFQNTGYRSVDILIETNDYDYENGGWIRVRERVYVWQLMRQAWFSNWPVDGVLHFVDGDSWNCSVDNIRAWSIESNRVVLAREDAWGYTFDKRLRGKVEVVETGKRYRGPSDAAKAVGGSRSGVSLALSGHLETHRGFHFRWV